MDMSCEKKELYMTGGIVRNGFHFCMSQKSLQRMRNCTLQNALLEEGIYGSIQNKGNCEKMELHLSEEERTYFHRRNCEKAL